MAAAGSFFTDAAGEGSPPDELQALVQFAFLRRPLAELLEAGADAGLDLIVLKGAALAERVYPRPSLRPFGDIDVLVRREDAASAHALLSTLGYAADPAAWADLQAGHTCQLSFFRHTPQAPVVVELHTDLLNNVLLHQIQTDLPGLWQRSVWTILAGRKARVLGPEDQILHLCLHLAGHYFAAPQSLTDIMQVCRAEPPDWDLLVSLARQSGAASACFAALSAAVLLRDALIPAAVRDALAPAHGRARLEQRAAARAEDREGAATEHLRFPLLWQMLDSGPARLRVLGQIAFPAPRWLVAHYFFSLADQAAPPELVPLTLAPSSLRQTVRVAALLGRLYAAHLAFLARRLGRVLFRRFLPHR